MPASDGTRSSVALRETLCSGVAFHNADLDRETRWVIEEHFRAPDSPIRVIVATTTLAMGVNTPAAAVIVVGLEHPVGGGATTPYSIAEYKNLVGRAGRLGVTARGESYLLATEPMKEYQFWQSYVRGTPENVVSRFLDSQTDIRSLVLRVLATVPRLALDGGLNAEEVAEFLESSFGAFQAQRTSPGWSWNREGILSAIEQLRSHRLIVADESGRLSLAELGRLAGEGGVQVESVIRLVECLSALRPEEITDPTLIVAAQYTLELDDVLMPINRKSTQKEPTFWAEQLRRQGVPSSLVRALARWADDPHVGTVRAKRAAACLLYVSSQPLGEVERILIQFGGAFQGVAGAIRSTASRTCDLLRPVARIAEVLHPGLDLGDRLQRLLVRLEVGIPAEAVPLAQYAPLRLGRVEYLALIDAGFCNLDALDRASDEALRECIRGDQSRVELLRQAARRERERPPVSEVTPTDIPAYVG